MVSSSFKLLRYGISKLVRIISDEILLEAARGVVLQRSRAMSKGLG